MGVGQGGRANSARPRTLSRRSRVRRASVRRQNGPNPTSASVRAIRSARRSPFAIRTHGFPRDGASPGEHLVVAVRRYGNFSFGVAEHTDFPSQEYDPNVGIYGLDVTVNLVRPGYRIAKRDKATRSIPSSHRLTPEDDAIRFLEANFDVTVEGTDDE